MLLSKETIHPTEKDGYSNIYQEFLAHESPKIALKNAQTKPEKFRSYMNSIFSSGKNFAKNMAFSEGLFAVLGSQGILVKCIAAIFFRTVDSPRTRKLGRLKAVLPRH